VGSAPDGAKGDGPLRRKENSSRGPADVCAFSYVAVDNPHPGAGMLTGFPFAGRRVVRALKRSFP
ncbi:hypothetical protein Tdes44962_MAKER10556, partial [Teratosphaeria destructans]